MNEEISPDASSAHRSQTTGHLVLTLPKIKYILHGSCNNRKQNKNINATKNERKTVEAKRNAENGHEKCIERNVEKLEIGGMGNNNKVDIYNIVEDEKQQPLTKDILCYGKKKVCSIKNEICLEAEKDFIDDIDVPPLV